ncbi:MAG: BrnA antitoxin family protein [Thiobacillaceae bacterium]
MKQKLIRPTETEDAAITAAALTDADNLPLTEADLAQFKRAPGRPFGRKKVSTTVRFDADVLEAMKATGRGWQTRINDVVREWVKSHPGS